MAVEDIEVFLVLTRSLQVDLLFVFRGFLQEYLSAADAMFQKDMLSSSGPCVAAEQREHPAFGSANGLSVRKQHNTFFLNHQ